MPTSPNSLTMTATRRPCSAVRIRLRSVVLPEPRNPVRIMTGAFVARGFGSVLMPTKVDVAAPVHKPGAGAAWRPHRTPQISV